MALTKCTPERVIAKLLIQSGKGIAPAVVGDWRVYAYHTDATDDQAIFVFGPPGYLDTRLMRSGEQQEKFGIHIEVRGKNPEITKLKAQEIETYFAEVVKRTHVVFVNDSAQPVEYIVHSVTKTTAMMPLGREEKNRRFEFSSNFIATIEEL